jgi:hypothetical protein
MLNTTKDRCSAAEDFAQLSAGMPAVLAGRFSLW